MSSDPLKILLIEANPKDVRLVQEALSKVDIAQFELVQVGQLSKAIQYLPERQFDVILLDLSLPDNQGLDTFTKMYAQAPDLPIVILIDIENEVLALQAVQQGAQDYLVKERLYKDLLAHFLYWVAEQHRIQRELERCIGELQVEFRNVITTNVDSLVIVDKNNLVRFAEEALTKLKAVQQHIIQQKSFHALGMTNGIANHFNNALSPILCLTELLLQFPHNLENKDKVRCYLQMMNTAAQDVANIVRCLRKFYRSREEGEGASLQEFYRYREEGGIWVPVDLSQIVKQAILLTQPKWKDQALARGITIRVETDLQKIPLISGNESELREVLVNLIFNAVDTMTADGVITIRTRLDMPHYAILEVTDTSTAMTEEARQRCMEPFFTTKDKQATDLGLAILYGIMQRHGSTVNIESEVGKGTKVIIRLPLPLDDQ